MMDKQEILFTKLLDALLRHEQWGRDFDAELDKLGDDDEFEKTIDSVKLFLKQLMIYKDIMKQQEVIK